MKPTVVRHRTTETMQVRSSLGARLFQPTRSHLTACLSVVSSEMTGAKAWAALHRNELLPVSLLGSTTRGFLDVPDSNLRATSTGESLAILDAPPTPAASVAVASCGVDALERAEQQALRVIEASAAWRSRLDKLPDVGLTRFV